MQYRSDIDGLRAIAVLSVIAFHSGVPLLTGGYVGVDVFFVISGYLITTLILKEIQEECFSFAGFYKRRVVRLLPALSITLVFVAVFGFFFYNKTSFDNLGKELFFSTFGAANILFAQGTNYFVNEEAYEPLIHLWSLGVEEQFYLIWPVILLSSWKIDKQVVFPITFILFLSSLSLSIYSVAVSQTKGYFLLQYRAFELLLGGLTALALKRNIKQVSNSKLRTLLSNLGLMLVIAPMFLLDSSSKFPGLNALWPCLGACLLVAYPSQTFPSKAFSHTTLVSIGLISYPMYLYHQPLISMIHFFDIQLTSIATFFTITTFSGIAAWITYKYVETPIRRTAKSSNAFISIGTPFCLIATMAILSVSGYHIAKTGGLNERFKYLNPFALRVFEAHTNTFHKKFGKGFIVSDTAQSSVLFVGDSVLQQYVVPIQQALGFKENQIDTVTRGGCVLLKGVEFRDQFSSISCDDIRQNLYKLKKMYDYIVISQAWDSYDSAVLNFSEDINSYERWNPFLTDTINHFKEYTNNIIVIGGHLKVEGTRKLQPSLKISENIYLEHIGNLIVGNEEELMESIGYFRKLGSQAKVTILNPYEIYCSEECVLSTGKWSFFGDMRHLTKSATPFVSERIEQLLFKVD